MPIIGHFLIGASLTITEANQTSGILFLCTLVVVNQDYPPRRWQCIAVSHKHT